MVDAITIIGIILLLVFVTWVATREMRKDVKMDLKKSQEVHKQHMEKGDLFLKGRQQMGLDREKLEEIEEEDVEILPPQGGIKKW